MKLATIHQSVTEMAELAGWEPTKNRRFTIMGPDNVQFGQIPALTAADALTQFIKYFDGVEETPDDVRIYGSPINSALKRMSRDDLKRQLKVIPDRSGFSAGDIKVINHEKTRRTIERWLNNNSLPHRWIIKFTANEPDNLDPTPGAITFIKMLNIGEDLLTPHMIFHVLGHAITKNTNLINTIQNIITTNTIKIIPNLTTSARIDRGFISFRDSKKIMIEFCKLLHMKAAFTTLENPEALRAFPDLDELINEIVGIYARNGRIKIEPNAYCDYDISDEQVQKIKTNIEQACRTALDSLVGKVIIDAY